MYIYTLCDNLNQFGIFVRPKYFQTHNFVKSKVLQYVFRHYLHAALVG